MENFTYKGFNVSLVNVDAITVTLKASRALKSSTNTIFKDGSSKRDFKGKVNIHDVKDIETIERAVSIEFISFKAVDGESPVHNDTIKKLKYIIDLYDCRKETFKPEFFRLDTRFLEADKMNINYGDVETGKVL